MDVTLPADALLTTSAPGEPQVELVWRGEIEPDRVSDAELELLAPILPELIAELMIQGSTDAE